MSTKKKKKSKAYFERLHTKLYNEADLIFKKYNPCKHDAEGKCANPNYKGCKKPYHNCCGSFAYNLKKDGMCRYYVDGKGCKVKSLSCKVWTCGYIYHNYPELIKELSIVREKAKELRIRSIRDCKRDELIGAFNRSYAYDTLQR